MNAIHVINKRNSKKEPYGLVSCDNNIYCSGCWDIDVEVAKKLIDGMIYLHKTKSYKSYFGGRIQEVTSVHLERDKELEVVKRIPPDLNPKKLDRVVFKFEALQEGKYQEWQGESDPKSSDEYNYRNT